MDEDEAALSEEIDVWLDIWKFKVMGILWCEGSPNEKIHELYHVIQDNHQESLAWNDKDLDDILKLIFDFSTKIVFKQI